MIAVNRVLALVVMLAVSQAAGLAIQNGQGSVAGLRISKPETLLTLKARELKGVPTRLSWSPDGDHLYLRVSRFDRFANETATHAVVTLSTREAAPTTSEPPWAARYWLWKSAPTSPAVDSWRFALDAREEQMRTTNVPRGGDIGGFMADGAAGYDELAQKAILANQKARIETLTLNGHLIDRTINTPVIPGRRFGWAPAPRVLVAWANRNGRLALMDREGRTLEVKGTKNVLLPAWNDDGTRIAFIERGKGDTYALRLVRIE
jgi:hypothetical protein